MGTTNGVFISKTKGQMALWCTKFLFYIKFISCLLMITWCSKHIEAWNKLIVKQKFCVSRWLITEINNILCLWFRASLIYINNCPTRYNTKQLIYYSASSQAAQKTWLVPEAAVTVLCTPYDGCGWHQKHVEWTCRIINRLLCVASRWAIINTNTISCECKWMALN